MALFQYEPGADLTNACDRAVNQSCGSADGAAIDGAVIGKFGQCLLSLPGSQLPGDCQVLVEVAATEGAHAGGITDEAKVKETLERLKEVRQRRVIIQHSLRAPCVALGASEPQNLRPCLNKEGARGWEEWGVWIRNKAKVKETLERLKEVSPPDGVLSWSSALSQSRVCCFQCI